MSSLNVSTRSYSSCSEHLKQCSVDSRLSIHEYWLPLSDGGCEGSLVTPLGQLTGRKGIVVLNRIRGSESPQVCPGEAVLLLKPGKHLKGMHGVKK